MLRSIAYLTVKQARDRAKISQHGPALWPVRPWPSHRGGVAIAWRVGWEGGSFKDLNERYSKLSFTNLPISKFLQSQ